MAKINIICVTGLAHYCVVLSRLLFDFSKLHCSTPPYDAHRSVCNLRVARTIDMHQNTNTEVTQPHTFTHTIQSDSGSNNFDPESSNG